MERKNNRSWYKNTRNNFNGPTRRNNNNSNINNRNDVDDEITKITGTNTKFEKDYYRLTSAPNPEIIRTEDTLKSWLPILISQCDNLPSQYNYLNSQLRSIRQDLTVQGIENWFTLVVYKTHAEIALENDDLPEFSMCLIRVLDLCHNFLTAPDLRKSIDGEKLNEVYVTHIALKILQLSTTKSDADLLQLLLKLHPGLYNNELIDISMKIYKACSTGNYWRYFKLTKNLPKHLQLLLNISGNVKAMRNGTVAKIVKSYRPKIELQYVSDLLGFESKDECMDYLIDNFNGVEITPDELYINTANWKNFSCKQIVEI